MYKALFTLGVIVGVAGVIGLSCGIYILTRWQQIASSGNASPYMGLYSVNSVLIAVMATGLLVSCLGAALGSWAYGKRNDQKPNIK